MVQTIIRVASVVLLFVIVSNLWAQKRAKEESQSNNKKKK